MLPKPERLNKPWQYEEVFRHGKASRNRLLVLHVWNRPEGPGRPARQAGFIVSKKVGKAVARNQVRRRIREAYRLARGRVRPGCALVWIARVAAAGADYRQIAAAVEDLLGQAGLLIPQDQGDPEPALALPV